MAVLIFVTLLGICFIVILVCFCALTIMALSKHSKLFFKMYLYFFVREDYDVYKEAKKILKSGGTIPVLSSFIDTKEQKGLYFLVLDRGASLWKDKEPVLVEFHQFVLDELIEMGNLRPIILKTHEADVQHRKELEEQIARLDKEKAECKAKLAKLQEE